MFILKTKINDEIEIRLPIYGDEIFAVCPTCGKEFEADTDMLATVLKSGDLAGSSVYCDECSSLIPERTQEALKPIQPNPHRAFLRPEVE